MFLVAASPAWAGVGLGVTLTFPNSVTVGNTGQPASLQITNTSTAPEDAGNVTIDSINVVPACGTNSSTASGDCPAAEADPGVFSVSSTGIGEPSTVCAGQTFTINVIDPSSGQVSFTPIGPLVVLTPPGTDDAVCRIDFTVDVNGEPVHPAGTVGASSAPTDQVGYALGTSSVDDATASGSGSSTVTVDQATPAIATTASAPVTVGGTISDSAVLAGGVDPVGTITFDVYGPSDATCTGTPAFSSSIAVLGNETYASAVFTAAVAGTYRFTASYGGDANNSPVSGACGAAEESVTVSAATPTLATTASPAVTVGGTISDTASLGGGSAPTGTITFGVFGPDNPTCSGAPLFTSTAPVNEDGTYSSQPFSTTAAGTYEFEALYGGDANNVQVLSACGAANESVTVSAAVAGPPALSFVKQSARRWRESNRTAHISSAKPPNGTTFSFSLNEAATVEFAFTQTLRGRRVKHDRCVARTKHNRHKPSCKRKVTAATLSFTGHVGTNKVSFHGRISRHKKLSTGTYTLVITAGNSAGSSAPRRLTFTIVK